MSSNFSKISVCILTKNAEKTIESTLRALILFEEVIVLDNGSTDGTIQKSKAYANVRLFEVPFIGFGPLRNQASSLAKNDWIFALDADEIPSLGLLEEIRHLNLDTEVVYSISRHNFYKNKHIKGCGWSPDRVVRLYSKSKTAYQNAAVHESVCTQNRSIQALQFPLLHTPYTVVSDFLRKMDLYSHLFAQQNRGRKVNFATALLHGFAAFFKSYVLKKGFLDGMEGFEISFYNANTCFYKYLKLREINLESKDV